MDEDEIFKALADVTRRELLDLLFQQNGQTLSALEAHFTMTRFGCMKHLKVLEKANLVTTRKVGREKYHYLNSVPIQLMYDRWVSKYAQPWTNSLTGLKYFLEDKTMTEKPAQIFEVFIRTTPEKLWQALTDGTFTRQYYRGARVESDWTTGASYQYIDPAGGTMLAGEILEIDPPHKLVTTFKPLWAAESDGAVEISKVTWEIAVLGNACKLTVIHDGLNPTNNLTKGISSGWAQILSSLKTLLETGEPLIINA